MMGYIVFAIFVLFVLYVTYEAMRSRPLIQGRYGTPTLKKEGDGFDATYENIMLGGHAPTKERAVAMLDETVDSYVGRTVYITGQGRFGEVEIYSGDGNIWTARYPDWDFPVLATELDKIVNRLDFYRSAYGEEGK